MEKMQLKIDRHHVIDHVEDNIDTLLARLEGQGKKVIIMTEEEEQSKQQRERDVQQ